MPKRCLVRPRSACPAASALLIVVRCHSPPGSRGAARRLGEARRPGRGRGVVLVVVAGAGQREASGHGQARAGWGNSPPALQRADDTVCVTGALTAGQPVVVGKSRSRPTAWPFGSWAARMSRSSRVSTRNPGHARKWSRQDDLRPDLVLVGSPEKMRSRLEGALHCFLHRRASPPSRRRHGGLSAKRQGP